VGGRFDLHGALELIALIFQIDVISFDIKPSCNVSLLRLFQLSLMTGKRTTVAQALRVPAVPSSGEEYCVLDADILPDPKAG